MANTQDSLFTAASGLLAAGVAILAGTPAGAPKHQYVAHGLPAFDCPDSLIVSVGTLQYGDFASGATDALTRDPRMHVVPIVPLTLIALRCVNAQAMPQGGVTLRNAQAAKIQADAEIVYRDGWSLFNGIHQMQRAGTLFAGYPCRAFEIDGVLPVSPEGGTLGWMLDVHVQLDGFDPPGA